MRPSLGVGQDLELLMHALSGTLASTPVHLIVISQPQKGMGRQKAVGCVLQEISLNVAHMEADSQTCLQAEANTRHLDCWILLLVLFLS